MRTLTIEPADADQRLDRFLRKAWPGATLGHIYKVLRRGEVLVNGAKVEAGYRLALGDELKLAVDAARWEKLRPAEDGAQAQALAGPVTVVHRDADLLVADKPAGLALHAGSGVRDHLLGRVQAMLGVGAGYTFKVAPAHRLDRDTSGLVVFGVSAAGLRGFTAALRERAVEKRYLALVHGHPPTEGEIDLTLAVGNPESADMPKTVPAVDGRAARTRYRVTATRGDASLVEVILDTGLTHQIRAHFAAVGCPVIGDRRYGRPDGATRLHLHAWRLSCTHPVRGTLLRVQASPPPELAGR